MMSSTYTSLYYHLVFSTKHRRPIIQPSWRDELHRYLGGVVRGLGGVAESIGGVSDHVHIQAGLSAPHCLAHLMRELKKASSVWSAQHHEAGFAWQEGYAAFSLSYSHRPALMDYIAGQTEHHRRLSFTEELKALLEKNGVKYDPKYLV